MGRGHYLSTAEKGRRSFPYGTIGGLLWESGKHLGKWQDFRTAPYINYAYNFLTDSFFKKLLFVYSDSMK